MKQFVKKGVVPRNELMDLLVFMRSGGTNWATVSSCTYSDVVPQGISLMNWNNLYAFKCFWVVINDDTLLTVEQAQTYKMTVVELHSRV